MFNPPLTDCNIINARLLGYSGLQQIQINRDGIIEAIFPMEEVDASEYLDVEGDWISLGGIDLQINGALGLAFPDLEKPHLPLLEQICKFLWQQGVDGFLPTLVTTSVEKIKRSLSVIAEFMTLHPDSPILGVHLEGPFLNREKRGAHPQEYLLSPTLDRVKQVLGDYASIVKIITLAPELDPTGDVIPYLNDLDITVSLGHSQATAEQAQQAFQQGASMVTHAFNAMPGLHHRQPGLLGTALVYPQVYCGLIADGQHVCPTMIQILLRAGGENRGIFLVSDALAPIGLPDGVYPWDTREITVQYGTAKLSDGTLAGTTLPLLVGVENLLQWDFCGIEAAIAMATSSPRKAIKLPDRMLGQKAHLLRWHWDDRNKRLYWERLTMNNEQ